MAVGPPLKLTVDRQNRKLVSLNGTPTAIPDLFQSNTITLQIQVGDPSNATFPQVTNQQFTVVNMAAFGLRAAVGDTPQGITGPTLLALQDTFVWDVPSQSFIADLQLNTSGIDTFLGTSPSKTAYFELNLTINGTRITILQTTFNLKAVADELNSNVPTPTDKYATINESKTMFQPRVGAPGDVMTLVSPNGLLKMEIGIDNTGQFTTNLIQ